MKKYFYSHLIETDSLLIEIHKLEINDDEKAHLISLVDSNLHHTILDAVLSELSEEDKKVFLIHLAHDRHNELWDHLNTKVDNIEEKIRKVAESLKKELHQDINIAKQIPEE